MNSSLFIQLGQGISCLAPRRKGGFVDCECFALKEKKLNLNHSRHGETCKQVIVIKRIKQTNKQKNKHNNFLKEKHKFWSKRYSQYFEACKINK